MASLPFDFTHPSISLRMTLSNVEEVGVVRFSNHVFARKIFLRDRSLP
jgi:hypothetical protein